MMDRTFEVQMRVRSFGSRKEVVMLADNLQGPAGNKRAGIGRAASVEVAAQRAARALTVNLKKDGFV